MEFQIQLPTETWNIELYTNDIRSEGFKIQEMGANGMKTITLDKCPTYAGKVNGADARFFIDNTTLYGKVHFKNETISIEPLSWSIDKKKAPENVWVLYKDSDAIEKQRSCGATGSGRGNGNINAAVRMMALPASCKVMNVAVDYDDEFYQLGGASKALAIMQEVDFIYFRDLKIRVNVCWLGGWSKQNPNYPFSNTADPTLVAGEFWSYWNNNRNNIIRDCAHMLTGKSLIGVGISGSIATSNGYANAETVGSAAKSYSLSDAGGTSSSDWAACASHEIAHNLGYGHDNDCSTRYIMCSFDNKKPEFSAGSKIIIGSFLDDNTTLGIRTTSIKPQLNFNNIVSTPTYISSNGQNLNIVNNDTYINNNTFTYSVNNPSVLVNQTVNPTFIRPNGIPYFTFTIQYTNTCGTFFRSIPFIKTSNLMSTTLYPNPSNGNLVIDFKNEALYDMTPKEIRVYNEAQYLIYSETIQSNDRISESKTSNQLKIDLQNQPFGKYFVILIYPNGTIKNHQIILEK
jgi:Metallo-peptidase family M12